MHRSGLWSIDPCPTFSKNFKEELVRVSCISRVEARFGSWSPVTNRTGMDSFFIADGKSKLAAAAKAVETSSG